MLRALKRPRLSRQAKKRYFSSPKDETRLKTIKSTAAMDSAPILTRHKSPLSQGTLHIHRNKEEFTQFNRSNDKYAEYQSNVTQKPPFDIDFETSSQAIQPTIQTKIKPIPQSVNRNRLSRDEQIEIDYGDDGFDGPMPPMSSSSAPSPLKFYRHTSSTSMSQYPNLSSIRYSSSKPAQPSIDESRRPNNGKSIIDDLKRSQDTANRDDIISDALKSPLVASSDDLIPDPSAEESKQQLQYDAMVMDEMPPMIDLSQLAEAAPPEMETPDFVRKYPDENDRSRAIDEYLGKPSSPTKKPPPDALILPMYAPLKDYCVMLQCEEKTIRSTLRSLGVYSAGIVNQESGQLIVESLRPKTKVILERWVDDLKPRVPTYTREDLKHFGPRDPVLCILGHVDHGKTTLLDYLRQTHVAEKEAGGITQSIGAFIVNTPTGSVYDKFVVFDTPGHAAFTGMRQRGAHVVDVAILIVAATDGVQQQTRESLAIIRKEQLPFVVAINKCDRPEADPVVTRKQLQDLGVFPHEIEIVEISAKDGDGVEQLLETVDLVCELEEPRGNTHANAELVVIEATKTPREGTIVNALVQDGTLRPNDVLLMPETSDICRVQRLQNARHESITEAGPSTPVSFVGFKELPPIGTILCAADDMDTAKTVVEMRELHTYWEDRLARAQRLASKQSLYDATQSMSQSFSSMMDDDEDFLDISAQWETVDDPRVLNVWIRADTWGSIEALENYLYQIRFPNADYRFNVVSKNVGPMKESITREADNKNCYALVFNVPTLTGKYKKKHLKIFENNVIFQLFEKFIAVLEDKLDPIEEHKLCGSAVVKQLFNVKTKGSRKENATVAGLFVDSGMLKTSAHFRVKRDDQIIYEQLGASDIKHFAVSVQEVEGGDECGLLLEFHEWEEGDVVECFAVELLKQKIDPPIFELDPDLEQNLYSEKESKMEFNDHTSSYASGRVEDDTPKVRMSRKKGKVVFDTVE